jgi:hypothetical protein
MQRNRLVDSEQVVESIRPGRANAQPEIDLREGSDLYRHGGKIVKSQSLIFDG